MFSLRAVTTATAAAALGISRKSLDNLLGRLKTELEPKGRQGVERRIQIGMLTDLFVTLELMSRLGATAREAFAVAQRLSGSASVEVGPFIQIQVDLPAITTEIEAQLEVAIESVVRRPRGRPVRP
ncbi:MAG: hypothetical protein OEW24_08075 [Chloroflexota bacterium]|nr:hypothetical protein [Chloroflexota bacterium]